MPNEFIASFKLNQPKQETVKFTIQQNNNITASFGINKSGGDKYFVFEQAESKDEWTIIHNLNKKPSVTVVDEYDRVVTPDIQYIDNSTIIVRFNFAFKGRAYLN